MGNGTEAGRSQQERFPERTGIVPLDLDQEYRLRLAESESSSRQRIPGEQVEKGPIQQLNRRGLGGKGDSYCLAEGIERPQGGPESGTMGRRMIQAPFHFGHDAQGSLCPDDQIQDISGYHERVERVP